VKSHSHVPFETKRTEVTLLRRHTKNASPRRQKRHNGSSLFFVSLPVTGEQKKSRSTVVAIDPTASRRTMARPRLTNYV
jgi:hypothetical protein